MEAFEYATMTAAVWLWERVGVGWVRMVAIRTVGPRCVAFPSALLCLTSSSRTYLPLWAPCFLSLHFSSPELRGEQRGAGL